VKTTVEKLNPTRVKLTIAVTPEELKPSVDHAYGHIAGSINIPGFRKGKVPPAIIDQRVGRGEVLNHAVSDALDKVYRKAVEEEKIRPLGRPEADVAELPDMKDFSGDLVVVVEVDVRPEFELPNLDGIELVVDAVTVDPEEIETEMQNLLARFGTLITVDRPAKTGDFAQIDLTATIGDSGSTPRRASPTRSARETSSTASTRRSTRSALARPRLLSRSSSVATTRARPRRSPSRYSPSRSGSFPSPTTTSRRSPASSTPSTNSGPTSSSRSRSRRSSVRAPRRATRSSTSCSSQSRFPFRSNSSKTRCAATSRTRSVWRTTNTAQR
jgi:hypothetical protein